MKYVGSIILLCFIFEIIFCIVFFKLKYKHYHKLNLEKEESTIKTLQEIAYDYHVRVFKSSWGYLFITHKSDFIVNTENEDSNCFVMSSDNTEVVVDGLDVKFVYTDIGDVYFINFRVLGKCYLVYGDDIISAWINVIRKARDLNKKFFYRNLDRQKL